MDYPPWRKPGYSITAFEGPESQPNVIDLKGVGEKGSGIDVFKNGRAQVQVVNLIGRVYTGLRLSGIQMLRAGCLDRTAVREIA
jgi:hypothetical protein